MGGDTKFRPYDASKSKLVVKKDLSTTDSALPRVSNIVAQFKSPVTGLASGPPLNLPASTTPEQLQLLLNKLLGNVCFANIKTHQIV